MTSTIVLLIITVLVALAFDFLNGFHDAANSIATVVSTRVLSPKLAVLWAAFFNFVAAFILGTAVAKTIGGGMIRVSSVTQYVVIAGLVGAIVWDLLTWWWGLPTSSSHALIGGYAGAAVMRSGLGVIIPGGWTKTLIFILVAPIMGLILGLGFMVAVSWLLKNKAPQRVDAWFRRLQLVSAAAYSIGHGGNDAQKTMGIVATALYGAKFLTSAELAGNWGRFHCRDRRRHHSVLRISGRHSRQHNPHHHRSHRRRRRHHPPLRRPLGSRPPHRLGLDSNHPRVRAGRSSYDVDHPFHQTGCVIVAIVSRLVRTESDLAGCGRMQTRSCQGSPARRKRVSKLPALGPVRTPGPFQQH